MKVNVQRYLDLHPNIQKHLVPSVLVACVLLLVYAYSTTYVSPWTNWWIALPANVVIANTALARINDMGIKKKSAIWQWRRLGLMLAGVASITAVLGPFAETPLFPNWRGVLLAWGFAISWLTSPNMPPWWNTITGTHREDKVKLVPYLKREWKIYKDSFVGKGDKEE